MTKGRRDRMWRAGLVVGLGIMVAQLVCGHGVPLLRHDWGIPAAPGALGPAIATLYEPWLLRGMGSPQPYPSDYLIGFLLEPMTCLPPLVFTWSLVAATFALVAAGGLEIGRALDSGRLAQAGCGLFAILNPWTYTEIVAGHIFMILAYGFVLLLCAETLRPEPRKAALVLWCALLVCQIEFFAFAAIPVGIWLVRSRNYLALAALALAALPIAFGMATHYQEIRGTPFLLEWQKAQSVDVLDGLRLRGYFAGYDGGYTLIAPLLWAFAVAGVVATIVAVRMRSGVVAILAWGWLALAVATGTKWVFAPLYSDIVLKFSEAGLFRELYDLVAFVAIAYVVSIAMLARSHRVTGVLFFALSAMLAYPWVTAPPESWFVPAALVPARSFPGTESERLALFPPIQPLSLAGKLGSGLDPDLFIQRGRAVPVNGVFPAYPEIRALARAREGDFTQLDALAVRYVLSRPLLSADRRSLKAQILMPRRRSLPSTDVRERSYPMLGLVSGFPSVVSVGQSLSANAIFFADSSEQDTSASSGWFRPVLAPRVSARASTAWIDARLAFLRYPAIATRFGGAFTTSSAPLAIARAPYALVWSAGRILAPSGHAITAATGTLRWVRLPDGASTLRCTAPCAIVALGDPPYVPREAGDRRPRGVSFKVLAPWLVRVSLPVHADSTLRWAVRYERTWTLVGAGAGRHVRLDQDLNGWILPAGSSRSGYLVNGFALAQLVLEIVSALSICVLFVGLATRRRKSTWDRFDHAAGVRGGP